VRVDLPLGVLVVPERPYLHGADRRHGVLRGRLDRLLQAVALQDVEAGHVLLGLRERPVGAQHLAAAHPYGDRVGGQGEPVPVPSYATVAELLDPGLDGGHARGVVGVVAADEQHVLHGSSWSS
jgi:hypothetical protein